jgi:SAM-dependent methyltransferase
LWQDRVDSLRPVSVPDVYGTARGGLRARLASKAAARARERRHARLFALTGLTASGRVLDVGCGALGLLALEPDLDVTGVDLVPRPSYPGPFVQADATQWLPFADGEFDLAYSSSVIEHVAPKRRAAFAAELKRVARGWYVQTPAYSFPIEPHALLPFAHWLPPRLRRPYWRLGVAGAWEDVALLRRGELEALFGPAVPERVGPLVKSWIAVAPVGSRR